MLFARELTAPSNKNGNSTSLRTSLAGRKLQPMNAAKTLLVFLCVSCFTLSQVGCVVFSTKNLPKVQAFPPSGTVKPSVGICYSFHTYLNDKERPATEFFQEKFSKRIVERFSKSDLFSSVALQDNEADLRVNVEVKHYGHGYPLLAFLSGLTLTIIPCRAEDDYEVSASVFNKKTGATSKIEIADSSVLWIHLLLVPAMPFCETDIDAFDRKIINNVMDTFALRVHEASIIK